DSAADVQTNDFRFGLRNNIKKTACAATRVEDPFTLQPFFRPGCFRIKTFGGKLGPVGGIYLLSLKFVPLVTKRVRVVRARHKARYAVFDGKAVLRSQA